MASFKDRLEQHYMVLCGNNDPVVEQPKPVEEKPGTTDLQPGSSHPDNWQTAIQTGKSAEEIRQDAIALAAILQNWQSQVLHAKDYFDVLSANSDKYLHMYNPILIKGLSREKMETIAHICKKFARLATIV